MLNRSGVAIVDEPHSYLIHRSQSCENFQTVKTMYVIDGPVFLLNKADAFFRKNVLICNIYNLLSAHDIVQIGKCAN